MPLRALVDGADVVAPLVSDQTWAAITERVRREPNVCRLPCCETPAYTRVSVRGVRHFVHRASQGDACGAASAPESELHLRAKAIVAGALAELGFTVVTEAAGLDWRADVLGRRDGAARAVAVEIQCSPQSPAETETRQRRYRRDGILGVWFATHVPPGLAPARDRPVFPLVDDTVPRVRLNGRAYALDDFLRLLFTKRIRFCERARTQRRQRIDTDVRIVVCPQPCGAPSLVWYHSGRVRSPCGLALADDAWKPHDAAGGFRPDIDAIPTQLPPPAVVARTDGVGRAGVRFDGQRAFGGERRSRLVAAFRCPACGTRFTPRLLQHEYFARPPAATMRREIRLAAPLYELRPHWCLPHGGRSFCE